MDGIQVIPVPPGTVVWARMATAGELDRWGMDPHRPAAVLVACGQAWPADRYQICTPDHGPGAA